MLNPIYDFILRLPGFKGKAMIEAMFRALLKPHISTVHHDIRMELDPEEWLQVDLRAMGRLEPRTTALFERILRPGDSYVDVGAHVGYHSLVAARLVGDGGRIMLSTRSLTIAPKSSPTLNSTALPISSSLPPPLTNPTDSHR